MSELSKFTRVTDISIMFDYGTNVNKNSLRKVVDANVMVEH
jgi:hypothetical protein